jgi:hypothetical protein
MATEEATVVLLEALTRRYHDVLVNLADMSSTTVTNMWDRLGGISDLAQAQFARSASSFVTRTQMAMARTTVTYIDMYVNLALQQRQNVSAVDIAALVAEARRGIPSLEVYMRPSITARRMLAEGKTLAEALRIARARAASAANTDIALAARGAGQAAMARHTKIVGYRRVPNATACEFCLVASTQRYHTSELMPLHNNCRCVIAPIIAVDDERVIGATPKRLQEIVEELKDAGIIKPGDLIDVHMHGELGAVLTRAGDAFAGLGAVR